MTKYIRRPAMEWRCHVQSFADQAHQAIVPVEATCFVRLQPRLLPGLQLLGRLCWSTLPSTNQTRFNCSCRGGVVPGGAVEREPICYQINKGKNEELEGSRQPSAARLARSSTDMMSYYASVQYIFFAAIFLLSARCHLRFVPKILLAHHVKAIRDSVYTLPSIKS
jgi:hypothetical protein